MLLGLANHISYDIRNVEKSQGERAINEHYEKCRIHKRVQTKNFFELLRKNALSRTDITRHIGLTRASATLIADELLNKGWIIENPEAPLVKSGRPPIINMIQAV